MAIKFKHGPQSLDPRDKHLVSFNPDTKIFVTEASSLKGAGIEPASHQYVIGGHKYIIFLWSEKAQIYITYRYTRKVTDGDVIADVFTPYFGMIVTDAEFKANQLSLGTELHILND